MNLALLGELDRIADQVEQDLPESSRIPPHEGRHVRVGQAREFQPLVRRLHGQHVDHILQGGADVEIQRLQVQLPGLDLGEVQDVVDQGHEGLGGRPRRSDVLELLRTQLRIEEQARHSQDAVHRRADLVTHVGQELTLGYVGRLCFPRQVLRTGRGFQEPAVGNLEFFPGLSELLLLLLQGKLVPAADALEDVRQSRHDHERPGKPNHRVRVVGEHAQAIARIEQNQDGGAQESPAPQDSFPLPKEEENAGGNAEIP